MFWPTFENSLMALKVLPNLINAWHLERKGPACLRSPQCTGTCSESLNYYLKMFCTHSSPNWLHCCCYMNQCWLFSTHIMMARRHQMETFSALLALCEGNPPVTDGFPSQRPVSRSFDVFFDVRLNKRPSKQSRCSWFETPWRSLWHHRNDSIANTLHKWWHSATGNYWLIVR